MSKKSEDKQYEEFFKNEPGTGALVPPELEWIVGKTAASIYFVTEAEGHLNSSNKEARKLLENDIQDIKKGSLSFDEFTDPLEWVKKNLK